MPNLTFRSVTHSFVSSLVAFVIVAVSLAALLLTSAHTVFAAESSGDSCSSTADCAVVGSGLICSSGQCVLPTKIGSVAKAAPVTKQIKDLDESNKSSDESVFKLTDTINNASIASLTVMIGGCSITGGCTDYDGSANQTAGVFGGFKSTIIAMFNNPPADSQTAIADALNSAGINIAQPAYAQGIGFSALNPILDTWKVFRNLAYLFFILVFVVIGFMIMFRQKVGQAAVTAQQAIPQIIIALIMVTFSYAIAGFLIDMMYLIMYALVGIFGQESSLIDMNIFGLGVQLISRNFSNVGAIGAFVDASLSSFTDIISVPISFIANGAFLLIITVAIVIGMFRLFFELLKTYLDLIMSIALAPIILMLGAIPGRSSFSGWAQSIIGNLAAFPTVLLVLIIFNMITGSQGTSDSGFLPPYLIGGGSSGVIPTLVGLAMILALPEIIVKVKQALGVKNSFEWLTSAAFKAVDRGQVGLPIGGMIAGGAYGLGANAGRILSNPGPSPTVKRRDLQRVTASGATSGLDRGKFMLKWYQRLREGRVTQMEDVESLLAKINDSNAGSKKKS